MYYLIICGASADLAGFEPAEVMSTLLTLDRYERERLERKLTRTEMDIKEVADMVGLSYDYQYRLLTQLRLTEEEQKRVSELGLGYEEIATRKRLIEIAPELKRAEIKKISKVVKGC